MLFSPPCHIVQLLLMHLHIHSRIFLRAWKIFGNFLTFTIFSRHIFFLILSILIRIFFSVKIQDIQLFSDHLVVYEREEGLPKVTIYHLPDVGQPLKSLHGGQAVNFLDPTYSVDRSESEFSSRILRFSYSSLKTPPSVYDYDMKTGISVLKKIETVSRFYWHFKGCYCVLFNSPYRNVIGSTCNSNEFILYFILEIKISFITFNIYTLPQGSFVCVCV